MQIGGRGRRRQAAGGHDQVAEELDGLLRIIQKLVESEEVTFLASDIDADGGVSITVPANSVYRINDVFAWTGVPAMFPRKDGWRRIDDGEGRPVLRLTPSPLSRARAPSRG